MTARQQATALGETRYHGQPCQRCGHTERQVASRHCMNCKAGKERRRYWALTGPEFNRLLLNRRRSKALRRMAERNQRKGEEVRALQT